MSTLWRDTWHTVRPRPDDPHGPLAPMLVLLTIVTGLVDAFSYLELGRVFVANMTGNVVFLSFAMGGAPGFLWWASLLAVVTFLLGALLGGRIGAASGGHRGRHLFAGAATQTALLAVAVILSWVAPVASPRDSYDGGLLAVLITILGVAMGLQNATARGLGVPDLTTTVLTMTLTGMGADSRIAGGRDGRIGRRLLSVLAMFAGGLAGVLLIESGQGRWVLVFATLLLGVVTLWVARTRRATTGWVQKPA